MTTDPTTLARAVVTALLEAGVREVVLAPGSRNAPLAFAVDDAAAAGLLRLHTRVDERTAGFLALGLARNRGAAAVVCTSGTAVANLHPAVLEAAHAGVALVAVTADRPARLRGTGANQTTDQVGVFGPLVPTEDLADVPVAARARPRPAHLNVQLDEPLLPDDRWAPGRHPGRAAAAGAAGRPRDRSRSGPAPSWWPATTPARPHGSWPSRPAGRCSPSPAAAPAPAPTRSGPTGCCSAPTSPTGSSGSSSSATPPCRGR